MCLSNIYATTFRSCNTTVFSGIGVASLPNVTNLASSPYASSTALDALIAALPRTIMSPLNADTRPFSVSPDACMFRARVRTSASLNASTKAVFAARARTFIHFVSMLFNQSEGRDLHGAIECAASPITNTLPAGNCSSSNSTP